MVLSGISGPFGQLSRFQGQVTHVLLTRAPLYSTPRRTCFSYDLHVLGTPPAFVLSQDQTLQFDFQITCICYLELVTIQFSKIYGAWR